MFSKTKRSPAKGVEGTVNPVTLTASSDQELQAQVSPNSRKNYIFSPSKYRLSTQQGRTYPFHQNPQKSWKHYNISGSGELMALMQQQQSEVQNDPPSAGTSNPTTSVSSSVETMVGGYTYNPDEMDIEEDSDEEYENFVCPEGITRVPFSSPPIQKEDLTKSAAKRASVFPQSMFTTKKFAKLKKEYVEGVHTGEYLTTPNNSPMANTMRW